MEHKLSSFGAIGDARQVGDAAIDAGSVTLTSQSATFDQADQGKLIVVSQAGPDGAKLSTVIAAVTSATQVEVAASASVSVSGKGATIGSNCAPALQAALDQIDAAEGGTLVIDGSYLLTSPVAKYFTRSARVEIRGEGSDDRMYIATGPSLEAIKISNVRVLLFQGVNFVGTPGEMNDAWRAVRIEDVDVQFHNCGFYGLASGSEWGGAIVSTTDCHVSVHDTLFGGCAGSNGVDNPTFRLDKWISCDFQRTHFIDYGAIAGILHSKTGQVFSYAWVLVGDPRGQMKGARHQGVARFQDCLFDEGCLWGIRICPATPNLRIRGAVIDGAQMNNTLIEGYSAIYAEAVDRLTISNVAVGWAPQAHAGIRLRYCGDVELDGVQLGNGVNGLVAQNVDRLTLRSCKGITSLDLQAIGISPVAADLDFENGSYQLEGTQLGQLIQLPGFSYSRTGSKKELGSASALATFAADVAAILPGLGYASRDALTNRLYASQAFNAGNWIRIGLAATPDSHAAPDQSMTADKLTVQAGVGEALAAQGVAPNNGLVTTAVFAKAAGKRWLAVCCNGTSNIAWFDLQQGVVGSVVGAGTRKDGYIYDSGGGWYLCVLVCSAASAANCLYRPVDADGSLAVAGGSGVDGVVAWEASCYNAALRRPPVITTGNSRASTGRDLMRFDVADGRYLALYVFDDGSRQAVDLTIRDGYTIDTHPSVLSSAIIKRVQLVRN
jgi:hypothetical protein